MSSSAGQRPNLVVVVLDCARASMFPGTGGPAGSFPSLEQRREECSVFTRASTVAPWTLPSHASLFTGRYPWDHGVMGMSRLQIDDSVPTVEGMLRRAGYSTLALSANGLVSPLFSRAGSFETYRSAEWWEKTFRWIWPESLSSRPEERKLGTMGLLSVLWQGLPPRRPRAPPQVYLASARPTPSLQTAVRAADPRPVPIGPWVEAASWAAIEGLNRIARALQFPTDPCPLPIAPWIEPTLAGWLAKQPADRPVHCFINFLDLHEKYLSDASVVPNLAAWLRFVRIPQNTRLWLQEKWQPTAKELEVLRRSYQAILRGLDRRLESLIRILEEAGRWENTLLVVTSDHGQAFGEHDQIFHTRSPYEPTMHVPLWVRWPRGEGGGRSISEPTSLVDVTPTLLRAASVESPAVLPGVPLQGESLPARREPVLAMADGYPSIELYSEGLRPSMMELLRKVYAIAYDGDFKAIVETREGSVNVFDLRQDPDEQTGFASTSSGPAVAAELAARTAADRINRAGGGGHDAGLEDRLRSWGYL